MKKIAAFVASALVFGGFGTIASAAEVNTQTTPTVQTTQAVVSYKDEAGITPDSLLYTIDKAVDQLRIMLAGGEEKEAAIIADIAQERLGESEIMTEKGKIELALKALEEYNEKITEAANKLQEVVVNLEAAAKEGSDEAAEEIADEKLEKSIEGLEKVIQEVQEKSLVVLDSLKDVATEESAEAVEEVIEEQTTHKEAVANFVKERHEFNAAKKALNMARVALKKIEKSGSEEGIKAAQDKLAAAQKEYMIAQAELHTAFQSKKAADLGIEDDKEDVDAEEAIQAPVKEGAQGTLEELEQASSEETAANKEVAKSTEYIKTNNGNGNKPSKVEKEKKDNEKSAPGKSGEAPGKSGQANGKKK